MYPCCKPPSFTPFFPLHLIQNIFGIEFRLNKKADRVFQWQTKQYLVLTEFTDKKGTCSVTNLIISCQSCQKSMGRFMFTSDHANLKESHKNRKGYLVTYGISFLNCYSLFDFMLLDLFQLSQEETNMISKEHSGISISLFCSSTTQGFGYHIYMTGIS